MDATTVNIVLGADLMPPGALSGEEQAGWGPSVSSMARHAVPAQAPTPVGAKKGQDGDATASSPPVDEGQETEGGSQATGRGGKRARELTETEVEYDVALLCGLSDTQVEEEEAEMLPPDANMDQYIKVRNHVLARWRADVTRWLSLEDAGREIRRPLLPLAELAWRFLNLHGWINWGVAPGLLREPGAPTAGKPAVVIVGAGLAGAAAARQLTKWGWRVLVLEGRNRPGGRVWSMPLAGGGYAGVADLGGAIVTGINGNPLAVLAAQLKVPLHHIRDTCPMYLQDGQLAPKELDEQVHAQHNALLDAAHEFREELPQEVADCLSVGAAMRMLWAEVPKEAGQEALQERLMQWHFRNVEFANAARLSALSLRSWDQDDPHEMLGPHVLLPGGNGRLVEALLRDVPVAYNAVVTAIQHGPRGVTVSTSDASYTCDAALVTVPLGVLKRGRIAFTPPLPAAKQDAIRRLGFGVLNKLVLLFPSAFWGAGLDLLAHVADDPAHSGLFYLFYAYNEKLAGRGAVLAALVSGEAAERFEKMDVEAAVERVMKVLRAIHEPQGITVPEPLQAVGTRWATDPMAFGSYSSVAVGATGDDYDTMAQSVGTRLFFGGEATISKWPATMHGAFLSGFREAAKIRKALEGPIKAGPAAPGRRRDASDGGAASSDESSESGEDGEAEGLASGGGAPDVAALRRRAKPRRRVITLLPAAVQTVAGLLQGGKLLNRLFTDLDPDVEFGCFAAFLGPAGTPWEGKALTQLDFRGARLGPRKRLVLYAVLGREQLARARDAPGGDAGKLAALSAQLGAPLLGRASSSEDTTQLLHAIITARKLEHLLQVQPGAGAAEPQLAPAAAASIVAAPVQAAGTLTEAGIAAGSEPVAPVPGLPASRSGPTLSGAGLPGGPQSQSAHAPGETARLGAAATFIPGISNHPSQNGHGG